MKKNAIFILLNASLLCFIPGCSRQRQVEHINVVMKKYQIQPAVIKVKSGDQVELEISAADVQHGFDVPQLGIKQPVQPGKPERVSFQAPARGEYQISCGIICGPHHDDMQAKLLVE
jgi:cytochrome c oxidase subunit 2